MAEREGFEPPIRLPVCRISSAVLSTAQPPLRAPVLQPADGAHSMPVSVAQVSIRLLPVSGNCADILRKSIYFHS